MTVIAVTHRLQLAAEADQVLVLCDGRLEASGRHEELLAKKGTYASLWAKDTARTA